MLEDRLPPPLTKDYLFWLPSVDSFLFFAPLPLPSTKGFCSLHGLSSFFLFLGRNAKVHPVLLIERAFKWIPFFPSSLGFGGICFSRELAGELSLFFFPTGCERIALFLSPNADDDCAFSGVFFFLCFPLLQDIHGCFSFFGSRDCLFLSVPASSWGTWGLFSPPMFLVTPPLSFPLILLLFSPLPRNWGRIRSQGVFPS